MTFLDTTIDLVAISLFVSMILSWASILEAIVVW